MQRRSIGCRSSYKIILTTMHKENREKNNETDYKRRIVIDYWSNELMIITIVIHPYKGKFEFLEDNS